MFGTVGGMNRDVVLRVWFPNIRFEATAGRQGQKARGIWQPPGQLKELRQTCFGSPRKTQVGELNQCPRTTFFPDQNEWALCLRPRSSESHASKRTDLSSDRINPDFSTHLGIHAGLLESHCTVDKIQCSAQTLFWTNDLFSTAAGLNASLFRRGMILKYDNKTRLVAIHIWDHSMALC